MKTRENAVNADADAEPHYRYDGVDEDGQHWLERVEIAEDGNEIFTEDYVPIRLHARKAEATEDVMPDQWMKDVAEEIIPTGCRTGETGDEFDGIPCQSYGMHVDQIAEIIARHYAKQKEDNKHVLEEMAKLAKAIGERPHFVRGPGPYIKAVAYLHDGQVFTLPAPARHHHLIWVYGDMSGEGSGFITNLGYFIYREEAWGIAEAAGQIIPRDGQIPGTLYSEDVW